MNQALSRPVGTLSQGQAVVNVLFRNIAADQTIRISLTERLEEAFIRERTCDARLPFGLRGRQEIISGSRAGGLAEEPGR